MTKRTHAALGVAASVALLLGASAVGVTPAHAENSHVQGAWQDGEVRRIDPYRNGGAAGTARVRSKDSFYYAEFNTTLPAGSTVISARLEVTPLTTVRSRLTVHDVPGDPYAWNETHLTWATQPPLSTTVLARSTTTLTAGRRLTIELPPSAIDRVTGDTDLRLALTNRRRQGVVATDEHANAAYRPRLTVLYTPAGSAASSPSARPTPTTPSSSATAPPAPSVSARPSASTFPTPRVSARPSIGTSPSPTTSPPRTDVLFSASRPGTTNYLRSPIPGDPRLDAAATENLNRHFAMSGTDTPRTNPSSWTHHVYYTTKSDPAYEVASVHTDWGCSSRQADGTTKVHIPDIATKSRPLWSEDSGTDGWLTVVNTDNRTVTNMWRARKSGNTWSSDCVGTFHLDGSGWADGRIAGVGTGAGHAAGAGVITRADLERGSIDHAMIVASNSLNSGFRPPANKSDGRHWQGAYLQEGMRLQLNPAVDCANLPVAGAAEKMICRAAQTYGFYIGDQTGCCGSGPYWGGVTFDGDDLTDPRRQTSPNSWEDAGDGTRGSAGCAPISATCGVWAHYGIKGVPADLSHIPWKGNMRVLATWNGR